MAHNPLLIRFADLLEEHFGFNFAEKNYDGLETKVSNLAKKMGLGNAQGFLEWILSKPLTKPVEELLINAFTIGETYFFREKSIFKALKETLLPLLVQKRMNNTRKIKIWSCGCCTGEEPYSIAITLMQILPDVESWNIEIIATDINRTFLIKARQAQYKEWAFRNVPEGICQQYFKKIDANSFALNDPVKKMVHFEQLNIISDSLPDTLVESLKHVDIILCCNTLMYFSTKQIKKALDRFVAALSEEGHFFVNAIEVPFIHHPILKPIKLFDTTAFVKLTHKEKVKVAPVRKKERKTTYSPPLVIPQQPFIPPLLIIDSRDTIQTIKEMAGKGQLVAALNLCKKAITTDTVSAPLYFMLATIQQELNQVDEAILSLKGVLFLNHEFIAAYFALGNLMLKQNKKKEATHFFQTCLTLIKNQHPEEEIEWMDGITVQSLDALLTNLLNKDII